jgi:hypothetical protein
MLNENGNGSDEVLRSSARLDATGTRDIAIWTQRQNLCRIALVRVVLRSRRPCLQVEIRCLEPPKGLKSDWGGRVVLLATAHPTLGLPEQ